MSTEIGEVQIKDQSILSGMILYPENGEKIDATYNLQGHKVSIKTINLDIPPQELHNQMLAMLQPFEAAVVN